MYSDTSRYEVSECSLGWRFDSLPVVNPGKRSEKDLSGHYNQIENFVKSELAEAGRKEQEKF